MSKPDHTRFTLEMGGTQNVSIAVVEVRQFAQFFLLIYFGAADLGGQILDKWKQENDCSVRNQIFINFNSNDAQNPVFEQSIFAGKKTFTVDVILETQQLLEVHHLKRCFLLPGQSLQLEIEVPFWVYG